MTSPAAKVSLQIYDCTLRDGTQGEGFNLSLEDKLAIAQALDDFVVFGLLIALVGCHYGLRVKPNTESLGRGTTASVVTSITVLILVDAVFAIVFKDVGV